MSTTNNLLLSKKRDQSFCPYGLLVAAHHRGNNYNWATALALLSMTKNAKKDLSVGNVLRANIGGNKKNILRLSQEHCVFFDMKLSFSIH